MQHPLILPMVAHVACLLLMLSQSTSSIAYLLAWTFIGGRIAHSLIQILTTNVRLRGLVFTINFLATLGLWLVVVLAAV